MKKIFLLTLALLAPWSAWAEEKPLPPSEAYRISATVQGGDIVIHWAIHANYYLYKNQFRFVSHSGGVSLGTPQLPPGERHEDPFFGKQLIYHGGVTATLPYVGQGGLDLELGYRGCNETIGFCYPPLKRIVHLDLPAAGAAATAARSTPPPVAEQDRLANFIRDARLPLVFLAFIGLGLLLTFTPCVLPMIPIVSGLVVGQQQRPSAGRALLLTSTYVLAMALTYTVAGVSAALAGANVQAWFQNPWVLSAFSLLFVALALSMFGLYELQMPGFIQTALTRLSNSQRSGNLIGVGIMGALSALIVGPCITAPLVAALIVVGQSGDPVRGGTALFALGLGMGLPLLAVGTSAAKFMPKAGTWMLVMKAVFGVQLLGVAVWFLSRILPGLWTSALWAALIAFGGSYLAWLVARTAQRRAPRLLAAGAAFAAVMYAAMLLESGLRGGEGFLAPFSGFTATATAGTAAPLPHVLPFKRIKTVADLDRELALASARHQDAMLDFYADWCVACKEMEHDTFPDPGVKAALTDTVLLQADVTANDDADQALYTRFKIYGPPSIMFFGTGGKEAVADRVVGYLSPADFTARIRDAFTR